jgi:hypothetical protein
VKCTGSCSPPPRPAQGSGANPSRHVRFLSQKDKHSLRMGRCPHGRQVHDGGVPRQPGNARPRVAHLRDPAGIPPLPSGLRPQMYDFCTILPLLNQRAPALVHALPLPSSSSIRPGVSVGRPLRACFMVCAPKRRHHPRVVEALCNALNRSRDRRANGRDVHQEACESSHPFRLASHPIPLGLRVILSL